MASPQAQAEYIQDMLDAAADIAEAGFLMSFGIQAAPANDYDPPGAYQEIGQANVVPIDWIGDFSNDVLVDDEFHVVASEVDLRQCTHARRPDGDLYILCKIDSFKLDNVTNLLYIVQTRGMYIGARDT